MKTFDVFTTVHGRSYEICSLLAKSLHLYNAESNINLNCITNVGVKKIPVGWKKVGETGAEEGLRLSDGYNIGLKSMQSEYVIFCHSDVVMLYNHWDKLLIELLETYKVVGVSYFNGLWSTLPGPVFCCAKQSTWRELNVSFHPKMTKKGILTKPVSKDESAIFKMKEGEIIKFDVGYEVPIRLQQLGYSSCVFPGTQSYKFFKEKERDEVSKGRKIITEWKFNNRLFLAHYQAVRDKRTIEMRKKWTDRIGYFLENKL
jgi:hypothetical protein